MRQDWFPAEGEEARAGSEGLSRRTFLKIMGGVTIYFTVGDPRALAQHSGGMFAYPEDLNAYLRIAENGRVSCFTGKIEMGQGVITSLAQMAAEELDVPLNRIDMVMGDTSLCPPDIGTFGSLTTTMFGPYLRKAAAEARAVLVQLAAERLDLPPDRLVVKSGKVVDAQNPDTGVTYAELTNGKKIVRKLVGNAPPKDISKHTICGKPTNRTDAVQKVTGEAKYTGDIRLPGMLYASILRPPAHGAVLKNVDTSGAEAVDGAKVVRDGDLIAVLHKNPDAAAGALEKIKAEYDIPEVTLDNSNIFEHLTSSSDPEQVVSENGDLEEGETLATKTSESVYLNNYVAHAPMETHTALAQVEADKATVWISTQTPFRARDDIAEILGIAPENVRVITPFVGGGFGGKGWNQQAFEAVRLAKAAGQPVQVAWSRKEEFFNDTFRPAAVVKVRSGFNKDNKIVLWDYKVFHAGERSSEPVYDIPNNRVVSVGGWMGQSTVHPFRVGAWRGPGSNTNVFAVESQIDAMASAAGVNPLDFRLRNLTDERMKTVLRAAADKFGGAFAAAPSGRGQGIACTDYHGTYVATIAQVKVDQKTGRITVERVVCAQDMGEVINPEGAMLQIEGCVTMGLGYVLTEEIRFKGGQILDENFDTYELPRFSWLPKIEVVLIDNPELAPQGCGEPAISPMGAVIANAVFDTTGARLLELPMTPERVLRALQKG
jgi:nicotinate dehydrogenase subunit B